MSARSPLLHFNTGYGENGKSGLIGLASNKQVKLFAARAHNRSGGAINVGLCVKLASTSWQIGQADASATPDFVSIDAAVKAGTASDIFTTTNNDGFLFQSDRPINVIGFTVSQAESGSPVYTYQYFNGTSYTTLTTIAVPSTYASGTNLIVFPAPQDWVAGTHADVGGSSSMYSILVRATTASGQAVKVTAAWAAKFLEFQDELADNGALSVSFSEQLPLVLQSGEDIMPYFGGTATVNNVASGYYGISD